MSADRTLRAALLAEGIGTAGLLMVVVGSGIMAERLAFGNAALALLANALVTGCGLFVLITLFAPVSGAHFNPLVSVMAWSGGELSRGRLVAVMLTQFAAAIAGTLIAHAMFGLRLIDWGTQRRTGPGQLLSELIATAGLVLVIRGMARREVALAAGCIAAYITAAYWFTASTSFANPAVTLARSLTTSFSGIALVDVPGFVIAQIAGALLGYAAASRVFPASG
jgi:glycerol uptake facilitator-like aquaporin